MAVDDFDFVSLTRCTEYLLEQGIVGEAGTKGVVGEGRFSCWCFSLRIWWAFLAVVLPCVSAPYPI